MAFVAAAPASARPPSGGGARCMRAGPDARAAGSSPAPSGAPAGRRAFLRAGAAAAAGLVLPRLAQAVGASVGITDVVVGTGAECGADSTAAVKMHYTLCLEGFEGEGGRVVDSSRTRGRPFRYTRTKGRGPVIAGWDMGVTGMKTGGRRRLVIPPSLGYGARNVGPIPADSTLYFDIELLGVGN